MKAARIKIVGATAWDYSSAAIVESAGIDIVLVGDSLAMTIRGDEDTLSITLDDMLYHTKMVSRACIRSMVVADMPFMSYQVNADRALINAGRFMKEGRANGVKMEGGRNVAEIISRVTAAGIPVMGHIGLTPQSVNQLGGYKVQGKSLEPAKALVDDALVIENSGAFAIVLECVPASLACHITGMISIPTIGIGAGVECDGQIQVTADIIGLLKSTPPKHAKRYTNINRAFASSVRRYADEVRQGTFPEDDNAFKAGPDLQKAIDNEDI